MVPTHFHVWQPVWGGRGHQMLAVKLTKAALKRQAQRGSKRIVRRWWKTRGAANAALKQARGENTAGCHVMQCAMGDDCPERMAVLEN